MAKYIHDLSVYLKFCSYCPHKSFGIGQLGHQLKLLIDYEGVPIQESSYAWKKGERAYHYVFGDESSIANDAHTKEALDLGDKLNKAVSSLLPEMKKEDLYQPCIDTINHYVVCRDICGLTNYLDLALSLHKIHSPFRPRDIALSVLLSLNQYSRYAPMPGQNILCELIGSMAENGTVFNPASYAQMVEKMVATQAIKLNLLQTNAGKETVLDKCKLKCLEVASAHLAKVRVEGIPLEKKSVMAREMIAQMKKDPLSFSLPPGKNKGTYDYPKETTISEKWLKPLWDDY